MDRQACGQGRSKHGPRHGTVALVLVLAVVMLGLAALIANPQGSGAIGTPQYHVPPRPLGSAAKATPFRAGVVLIGFRAGVTAGQRAATERAAGALDARQLGPALKPAGHGRVAGAGADGAGCAGAGPGDDLRVRPGGGAVVLDAPHAVRIADLEREQLIEVVEFYLQETILGVLAYARGHNRMTSGLT